VGVKLPFKVTFTRTISGTEHCEGVVKADNVEEAEQLAKQGKFERFLVTHRSSDYYPDERSFAVG
jgi:hypothetical protein